MNRVLVVYIHSRSSSTVLATIYFFLVHTFFRRDSSNTCNSQPAAAAVSVYLCVKNMVTRHARKNNSERCYEGTRIYVVFLKFAAYFFCCLK